MYIALGILYLIIAVVMAVVIAYTTIRSFKTGDGFITKKNMLYLAPTFLILYVMHITASAYNGEDMDFFYCFTMIYTTLDVLKFRATKALLLPICKAYPIFYVDFVLAFLIGGVTVILSIASFFSSRVSNFVTVRKLLRSACDIVVGDSPDAIEYVERTKNCLLLGTNISSQRYSDLIKLHIPVLRIDLDAKQLSRKLKHGGYNIIVFRDGSYAYTKIIETFTQLTDAKHTDDSRMRIYFEANQQEMKILKEKFITQADNINNLFLTGFSKYELMARRFVVDYPITKYIPRSFYNDNCTIKSDKEINVVFVGFGKVNYQLFRMCAMQFQFARQTGGKLESHPVNYHICDNADAMLHNEFFSRIEYEFDEVFSDCDFPKPEKICELKRHKIDINSVEAKQLFKSMVKKNSFTYFIVSLDSDLADASYAQTVMRLLDGDDNYRIFVRAKNKSGEKLNDINDRIIYFGEEKNLYTHDNIINDDLTELAQRINLLYREIDGAPSWLTKLRDVTSGSAEQRGAELRKKLADPKIKDFMLERWAELPHIEQASNLYHALNLPFKLNLLGFEIVKKDEKDDNAVCASRDDFNKKYVNSGRKDKYNDYAFYFGTESSNVLAYIEHARWNALYILYDYKQMKKADMKVETTKNEKDQPELSMPHKNIDLKEHACITTYYGLSELIAYKYENLYPDEALSPEIYKDNPRLKKLSKVYNFDYMDLDRIYDEIVSMGYVLTFAPNAKEEEKNGKTEEQAA